MQDLVLLRNFQDPPLCNIVINSGDPPLCNIVINREDPPPPISYYVIYGQPLIARMFGVFAIDEIIRYRGTRFPGSRTLCHPGIHSKNLLKQ